MKTRKIKIPVVQFEDSTTIIHVDKSSDCYLFYVMFEGIVRIYNEAEMLEIYNYKIVR